MPALAARPMVAPDANGSIRDGACMSTRRPVHGSPDHQQAPCEPKFFCSFFVHKKKILPVLVFARP
jgi:hypothetical protein